MSFPRGTVLQEGSTPQTHSSYQKICSCMGSSLQAAIPDRGLLQHGISTSCSILQGISGLQSGYLFWHGPPWAAGSMCFTTVFSKGCRGVCSSDWSTSSSSFSDLAVCRAVSHCPLSSTLFPQLLSFYFSKILLKRQNQNKITLKNKGSSVENEFCIIVLYVFSDVKQQFLQVGQLMFKNRHSIFLGWTVTRDNESFLLN